MKLPSLSSLLHNAIKVVMRFPIQIVITILAVIIAFLLTDADANNEDKLARTLAFCLLAFNLSLSSFLFAESRQLATSYKWLLQLLAIAVCALIMFWLHPNLWQKDVYLLLIFILAFHLMVSFSSFLNSRPVLSFWHFNKSLFLRFLTAALYSVVITLGLFAAIAAIDNLFDVTIKATTYPKVASIVCIGFNTIFFLAGVPEINSTNNDTVYPKGLKIFTQYVLIPLMTVYLIILFLYELKIIFEWSLPKGYVSLLILAYSVFGVLSLLLVYPIREMQENKWIKWFSKFFYVMMLPLLVLFVLAIYKRISDYGITEERYALIVLAIWLTGITFYFLFSKKDNIKIIPITLTICCLISAIGPQGAAAVSKRSQLNRLKTLIGKKGNETEVSSIVNYLVTNHGLVALQSFTEKNLTDIQNSILGKSDKKVSYVIKSELSDTAFSILKIDSLKVISNYYSQKNFKLKDENLIDIKGYETAFRFESYQKKTYNILQDSLPVSLTVMDSSIEVKSGNDFILFPMDSICNSIATKKREDGEYEMVVSAPDMKYERESSSMKFRLQLIRVEIRENDDKNNHPSYTAYLLIGRK